MYDPEDLGACRADAMSVGIFLLAATAALFGLKKLGFRAVIGVGK